MSGSAVADAAGIGKIIIGMMVKSGRYTRAATPPRLPPPRPPLARSFHLQFQWFFMRLVSNASVGRICFLAGIVPGLDDGRGAHGNEHL